MNHLLYDIYGNFSPSDDYDEEHEADLDPFDEDEPTDDED